MRILVVEDEGLVAKDIQVTLQGLGYDVPPPLATAEAALAAMPELKPALVLMDIRLKGQMDGIEAASVIRGRWRVPVIFLTAHSDEATLTRAKVAEPFGYVVKPFEETDLRTAIEVASYKHTMEERTRRSETLLSAILKTLSEAVICTDNDGRIIFANDAAQRISGIEPSRLVGMHARDAFPLRPKGVQGWDAAIEEALKRGRTVALPKGIDVVPPTGLTTPVEGIVTPLRDAVGTAFGYVLTLRDERMAERIDALVSERDMLRAQLRARAAELL